MAASNRHTQKRHGKHQRHTRDFLKVYTPYLPMLMIVIVGLVLSVFSPPKFGKGGVLPYATSMSVSDLLSSTNSKRTAQGLSALKIDSKLNSAAQSKANDMVARDYWSHITPDGKQPWVFVSNAGYSYQAAAENLAYGFSTSSSTITGWMNSPEHKVNMLNSNYTEVGFGFKNSPNFVGSGEETVIVAFYAKPAASKKTAVASSSTANSTQTPATQTPKEASTTKKTTTSKKPAASSTDKEKEREDNITTAAIIETPSQPVNRVSSVTNSNLAWITSAAVAIVVIGIVALIARHTYAFNKWLKQGERYVLHHFVFDITIVSLIGLCYVASQSVGFIR